MFGLSRKRADFSDRLDRSVSDSSTAGAEKAKLAISMLFIFLLTLTILYEWRQVQRRASWTKGATRAEMLQRSLETLAEECVAQEDYLGAIVVFETLLEAYPESELAEHALCKVGMCWLCLDNSEKAMEAWEKFLK